MQLKRGFEVLALVGEICFEGMGAPQTPFSTAPMPSKHISPNANTSNPLFNCPHALKTHFTQCQHLEPPFQLPPCPQNIFHPVPTWGQLKRGFEVLALGEMCFEGMGAVEKGV